MPLTNFALDKFVSQHLSDLGVCTLADVGAEFPQRQSWISNFVLTRIVKNHVGEDRAALAFALLRRAEAAFEAWDLARAALAELATKKTSSRYFKSLRQLENVVAALEQGAQLGRDALKLKTFTKGDGSEHERLNSIYNTGRHFDPGALPPGHLHAVWIATDGIRTNDRSLTFDDLQELLRQVGRVADGVSTGVI